MFLAECFVIDGLGCLLLFVVFWFICCLLLIRWVFWFDWLGLLLISVDCDLIVVLVVSFEWVWTCWLVIGLNVCLDLDGLLFRLLVFMSSG